MIRQLLAITGLFLTIVCSSQVAPGIKLPENKRQYMLPYDRKIQPAGLQIKFGSEFDENHALDAALSPDGKWLAVLERYSVIIINTAADTIQYRLLSTFYDVISGGMNTYSGITWYRNNSGLSLFWGAVGRDKRSYVISVKWDGKEAKISKLYEYNTAPPAELALPNEIIIRREGRREYLYTVLNGNNMLIKQDLASGDTVWITGTGVAPYGIASAAGKLYVTNWAGRHPSPGDTEVAGVPWGSARVNNSTGGGTREGSISVINPASGKVIKEIVTGLHSNEIISDSKGTYVYVTNSNSDNISVISTLNDEISETISVRLQPDINPYFGDSPNGLCLSKDEKLLYVANGMDNAIAVINLGSKASAVGLESVSRVTGYIPTGAYPSSVTVSNNGKLYVTNLEGEGARTGYKDKATSLILYNSHRMYATVSVIPVPDNKNLKAYTDTVLALNDLARALSARLESRPNVKPRPVPERIGEPSVFRHVVYIIKENRTYDQILGDMKQGNGEPRLCTYGLNITPNTHKISEDFLLLDNFHASGKSSAEGHQWTDASIVTDYIEKNMRAWFRSYAHVQTDALVYAPTGFLWDNAVKHGRKVRIYGEAAIPEFPVPKTWKEVYGSFIKGEKIDFKNITTVEPVKKLLCETYPGYGDHEFPDIMRADAFIKELRYYEGLDGDQLPELIIMALPNDHTAGINPDYPTPRAMIADNDLALGQIVEAISKSKFWRNTVIFVTEDDSQSGWDHVSAYRTVGLVISAWSRMKITNSTFYTQPSMIRTIEQILGLPPMNIQDAIASPMTDCFNMNPDFTPYTHLPARIPLDQMNKPLAALRGKALYFAKMSMLPEYEGIDSGNDDMLNRILWFDSKGNIPYPSKYAGISNGEEEEKENNINK